MISEAVEAWVTTRLGVGHSIEALAGDASTNRFFRVLGAHAVLMVCSDPERFDSHVHMSRFFQSLDLPVALLLSYDAAFSALLMEDLGDRQLWQVEPSQRPAFYEKAIDLIIVLQRGAGAYRPVIQTGAGDYAPPILGRERLLWELEFFSQHYLRGLHGRGEPELERVRTEFERLLDGLPMNRLVFCHRDYHSRNLMLRNGEIVLIDLQDARWGHPLYDLVSLLGDSYVDLDPGLVAACQDRYLQAMHPDWPERSEFERQYEHAAVQRNFKAIGTFAAQAMLRGKKDYLEFIAPTKRQIARRLTRPEFAGLRTALDACGFFEVRP